MPENVTDANLKSYADGYTLTTNIPFTADEAPVSATPQTWTDVSFEVPAVKPTDRLIIYATVDGTEKGGKARYEVDFIEVVPSSVKTRYGRLRGYVRLGQYLRRLGQQIGGL